MKRFFSERNIAAILFVVAMVVFSFAQQDARKVEEQYLHAGPPASSLLPASPATTDNRLLIKESPSVTSLPSLR